MKRLIFISRLLISISFFFLVTANAQNEFIVFNVGGSPKFIKDGKTSDIKRGKIINHGQLKLKPKDTVRIITKQGDLRELYFAGTYDFEAIKQMPTTVKKTAHAKEYLAYIWKQLLRTNPENAIEFEDGELVLMRFPADSIRIFMEEISFEWQEVEEKAADYYFLLKNNKTDEMETISCSDNFLTLKVDDDQLSSGTDYEWAVSDTRFFKTNELRFFKFHIMNKEEFKAHSRDLKKLTSQLKKIGLSKNQIRESICEFSKFCY